jgi:hypothetical protein
MATPASGGATAAAASSSTSGRPKERETRPELRVGNGRFRVERQKIGSGSFGDIYLGTINHSATPSQLDCSTRSLPLLLL